MPTRRKILAGGAMGLAMAATGPRLAWAQGESDKRLLLLIQRGAADGLSLAAPLGDPGLATHRAQWIDDYEAAPRLDSMFALHPALAETGRLYADGDALVVHAVATSYRERSHFDAQNLLESGGSKPFERKDGFLNRLLGLVGSSAPPAIALASAMPLALRGDQPASTYAPGNLPEASEALLERIPGLYADDPQLARMWEQAQEANALRDASDIRNLGQAREAGQLAGRMLADPAGARVVMLDLPGWDSHAGQVRMLANRYNGLDTLVSAFRSEIGKVWDDTLVVVVTEFGRTVAINGTNGTDHGTGGAALLLGGAVRGGRVVSDWPGLAPSQLYEGRDLMPTMALEAVLAGALSDHFGLDAERTLRELFPGRAAKPVGGLIG